jgi:hypothetical protein
MCDAFFFMGCKECTREGSVCSMFIESNSGSSAVQLPCICGHAKNKHEPFLLVDGVLKSFAPNSRTDPAPASIATPVAPARAGQTISTEGLPACAHTLRVGGKPPRF